MAPSADMFDPSFMRSKYGTFRQTGVNDNNDNNDNINNDEENNDYDCNHKIAKQEQRNRENRFVGLRLSSNVSLSLIIPFLI